MYQYTSRVTQYKSEMIRLAEVAAGQILWFYDQQAVLRQSIVGDRNGPAAECAADNMLEFGAAFGSGVDYASRYFSSYGACPTSGKG